MAIDLKGKPIVIAGASSGIGRATAIACARAGMPVVLGARRMSKLEEVAREIESLGGRAAAIECDVSKEGECEKLIELCAERFGPLYAAYANAGYGFEATSLDTGTQRWREIFEVNFFGTIRLLDAAIPTMLSEKRGHALICSSCLGRFPTPLYAAYTATKAAQHHLGRAMDVELRGRGVRVSTVHPIGTRTEFFDTAHSKSEDAKFTKRTPRFAMQHPETVAKAIVKCLRRPKPEVWTSFPTRTAIGIAAMFPKATDAVMRRMMRDGLKK
jgi:short-subunit dehydrogenase